MKHRRRCRNGMTAFWIALMILFSAWSVILFAEVDSEMPMHEEGAIYERN